MTAGQKTAEEKCSDCDKIRIEKQLEAEESARAFQRELEKLARQKEIDFEKLGKEHELALDSAENTAITELQKSHWQTEFDLGKLFHEKISEVAGASIERARDSAKYVQTAAAAIATLYTSLLALVFSVTDNPLPIRGVYAAVFLGLAVALATAYLAFFTKPDKVKPYAGGGSLTEQQLHRTAYLVSWINSTVLDRRWAIRASVVSLAVGVAFIPAAFVAHSRPTSIPDPPAAPQIPGEVAAQLSKPAADLFRAQLQSYKASVNARNDAIKEASEDTANIAKEESKSNSNALVLALIGLAAVLIGPLAWGYFRDKGI